ncbi:AraC family transcriptional regulator [Pendulispora brunnea]|uniref:AraC family transcriptional regulator n=1 Tax=Pendulispora brunnea TaxID=2905690 RepID=A0ABZ2K8E7_9BACT
MYREYAPGPPLAPYVECFWTKRIDVSRTLVRHRVLPDGCMDILFYLDGRHGEVREGLVVGTMTRALLVDESASGERVVAVRFRPGAAIAFLATPAHELTDRNIALSDIWRDTDPLRERLRTATSLAACVGELERALLLRLAGRAARPLDPLIGAAVGALRRVQDEPPRIGELARSLGVSRQHLAQKFKIHVGIGPKEFERVVRMTRLTERLLAPGRPKSTAELAYDLGYYDQAHMIHEFKALTGLTPREYASDVRDSIFPIQEPGADAHSPV